MRYNSRVNLGDLMRSQIHFFLMSALLLINLAKESLARVVITPVRHTPGYILPSQISARTRAVFNTLLHFLA